MTVTVGQWLCGQLSNEKIDSQKWLLRAWVFAAPLGYLAVETGWIVRCVGRQPWTVYNQIRTVDAASKLPAGEILTSLIGILSALAAIILKLGIGWLGGWRVHLVANSSPFLVLPLGGFLLGYSAGWIVTSHRKMKPSTFIFYC